MSNSHRAGDDGIGDRLGEALRQRGIRKLYPLALQLGVHESALSRWRTRGDVSLDNAIRLARELDISLDWLLLGRGGIDYHKTELQLCAEDQRLFKALLNLRNRLSPQAVDRLIEFIESL